jgi:hypothetical protein
MAAAQAGAAGAAQVSMPVTGPPQPLTFTAIVPSLKTALPPPALRESR